MRIGELSKATGASARSLRYCEERGLIRSRRSSNGDRSYDSGAVEAVGFVRDLLAAGLPTQILREVMPCITGDHEGISCRDLVARVQLVREDLLRQEQLFRTRRETLQHDLTGRRSPRGVDGMVLPETPARTPLPSNR